MTDLKQKLLKALAFDDKVAHKQARRFWDSPIVFCRAAEWENARLKPLHEALVECADALDAMIKAAADKNCGLRIADEALAKLQSLVDA